MTTVYSKTKIFHYLEKIDSLPKEVEKIFPPVHIRIKPTNVCNHRCSYCAYREDNLQLGQDMIIRDMIPKKRMMEIIDDIVDMGVKAVTFSGGGEPFCYQYLLEAVKKLSTTNIKFAALTNGSRLSGEIAEIFAKNATWVRISMDGWNDESYMSYRGVKHGEFSLILKNIRNFKKIQGPCKLGVSIIVDHNNADHILELMGLLKDNGISSVKIAPCIVSNNGIENNKYHENIFEKVKKHIAAAKKKLYDQQFDIYDSYHFQLETFKKVYHWCPYQQILPVIGADLNVYSCQDKAYNLESGLLGTIKDKSFKNFWFSGKNKFFNINPSISCNHHCVANEKNKMILEYINANKDHLGFV